MKTITISSLFVLSALVVGMVATPSIAFADHIELTIAPVEGAGFPGCEETPEGCSIPTVAIVDVGGKVIFTNTDTTLHTNTAGLGLNEETGEFDTSLLLPGNTYEWTPTEAGEVAWYCQAHPWMTGTIIVQEAGATMDDEDAMMDDETKDEDAMMDDETKDEDAMMDDETKDEDAMMDDETKDEDAMMDDETKDEDAMMDDETKDEDAMMDDDRHTMMEDASVTGMLSDGTMVKIWADAPAAGEMMEIFIKFANYGSMDDTMMEDKDEMMDDTMMEDKDEMMDDTMMEDKDEMMDDTMMEDKDEMMDDTMMEDKDEMMDDTMMEDKDEMMDDTMMEDKDEMMDDTMMDGKTGVEHVNYDIVVTQNGVNVLEDMGAHSHDGKYTHTTAALASADPVEITVTFQGFGLPDAEEFTGPVGEGVTFMNVVPEFGTVAMMVLAVAIISIVAITAKSRVVPRL